MIGLLVLGLGLGAVALATYPRGIVHAESNVNPTTTCALSGARIGRSAVAVGNLDGDSGKEIVVAGSDGRVYAINPDCSAVSGWPSGGIQVNDYFVPPVVATQSPTQDIESTPALANLDGDSQLEVIVTVGYMPQLHQNGGIIVFDHNGLLKAGWPKATLDVHGAGDPPWYPDGFTDGVFSTPAIGDIDGDGQPEIVYGAFDKCIYAWNADGSPVAGWWSGNRPARCLIDTIWSSPSLADLNDDGVLDIILGTDAHPSHNGGSVWAIKGNNTVLWTKYTTQVIVSSPAVGDLDNDGDPEIVVGTGDYYTQGYQGVSDGHKVYALDHLGRDLPSWPRATEGNMPASPSLADLDGNGDLEILVGCGTESFYDTDKPLPGFCNKLYAWHHTGMNVSGYPATITRANPWPAGRAPAGMPYGPILADYENNGTIDVFVVHAGSWGITRFPYNSPASSSNAGNHYYSSNTLQAPPVIENLYNDNRLHLIAGGATAVNAGNAGAVYIWDLSNTSSGARPWPMFRRDVKRNGYVPMPPRLSVVPSSLYVLHQAGTSGNEVATLILRNLGDGSFSWSATKPSEVTLAPASGVVTSQTVVNVTVNTAGKPAGTHELGAIVVTAVGAAGSPKTVPVTLYVGQVHKVHLPLIRK